MLVADEALIRLFIPALSRPLAFERCPDLAAAFSSILHGWNLSSSRGGARPLGTVRKLPGEYRWSSHDIAEPKGWDASPPGTVMEALCDLHFELIEWFLDVHSNHLCIHCAAVEMEQGLVVFPSPTKAGKSTLTLQLAASGHRIFGDDVLPLEPERNEGFALGLSPRIRLPLPKALGAEPRAFLETHAGPGDRFYRYVDLSESELAQFGETAPVAALVLLERKASGPAHLEPVSQGEMLKLILRRNFADEVPAPDIFDRLHALCGDARRLRLTYSDGRAAVALLDRELGAGSAPGSQA